MVLHSVGLIQVGKSRANDLQDKRFRKTILRSAFFGKSGVIHLHGLTLHQIDVLSAIFDRGPVNQFDFRSQDFPESCSLACFVAFATA